MQHILVIEPSATMRHGMVRLLQDRYALHFVDDYASGIEQISAAESAVAYAAVVLHWPTHAESTADELIMFLSEPEYEHMAVLILAFESNAANHAWLSMRPHSAMLHLDNILEISESLDALLQATNSHESSSTSAKPDNPISILFVDDSPTVRSKFRRLLLKNAYEVSIAGSSTEAVKLAHEQHFDIAIIDYFMPNGNGDQLCHELKQDPATRHITCAILTGTYLDKVITDSLSAGAVECMFKSEADTLFLARVAAMSRGVIISRRTESERLRLDGILESVGDGVYGVDPEGHITFINPSAKRLLGYSQAANLTGRKPQQLFHQHCKSNQPTPTDIGCALKEAYQHGKEINALETVFSRHDGSTIQVELTIRPLRIDDQLVGAVVAFRDISMRKLLEDELKWQANHDPLTKLVNRKYFEDALQKEVIGIRQTRGTSALLYIDLDRFKYINDTAGHAAGDSLLIEIAHHLESRLRGTDLLARLGGDEFAIILRNISLDKAVAVAEAYREMLARYAFAFQERTYKINGSIGIAMIDEATRNAGEILANADIACHIAKGKGRNLSHLYEPMSDSRVAMDMELGWSAQLEQALNNDGFILHYQPIVAVDALIRHCEETGHYISSEAEPIYECLLRLPNSRGEMISPSAFLPTAERFNMMPQLDRWVIGQALEELATHPHTGMRLSINISGQSLGDPTLCSHISNQLHRLELEPQRIIIEITETCAVANIEAAQTFINEMTALGCVFALDDFGSGYCSFSHLKNLPVDYIKIDGAFVQGLAHDEMDGAIVRSINDIAHSLGKKTVAEHVESPEVMALLREYGVDYVQGIHIAPPALFAQPVANQPTETYPSKGNIHMLKSW